MQSPAKNCCICWSQATMKGAGKICVWLLSAYHVCTSVSCLSTYRSNWKHVVSHLYYHLCTLQIVGYKKIFVVFKACAELYKAKLLYWVLTTYHKNVIFFSLSFLYAKTSKSIKIYFENVYYLSQYHLYTAFFLPNSVL